MVKIIKLDAQSKELLSVNKIYEQSFSENERTFPLEVMVNSPYFDVLAFVNASGKVVGFSSFILLPRAIYCLLVAVDKEERVNTYGIQMAVAIKKYFKGKFLFGSIERENGIDEYRKRRKNYYKFLGAVYTGQTIYLHGVVFDVLANSIPDNFIEIFTESFNVIKPMILKDTCNLTVKGKLNGNLVSVAVYNDTVMYVGNESIAMVFLNDENYSVIGDENYVITPLTEEICKSQNLESTYITEIIAGNKANFAVINNGKVEKIILNGKIL